MKREAADKENYRDVFTAHSECTQFFCGGVHVCSQSAAARLQYVPVSCDR